jgi:hypothetical protein
LFPEADRIVTPDDGMGAGVDWVLALVLSSRVSDLSVFISFTAGLLPF